MVLLKESIWCRKMISKEVRNKVGGLINKVSYGEAVDNKVLWEEIVEKLQNHIDLELCYYNERFCRQVGRKWKQHSLFCDKISKCERCPLSPCMSKTKGYGAVDNHDLSFEERVAAAKEILEISEFLRKRRKPVEMREYGTLFLR